MCLLIAKPAGAKMPDPEVYDLAALANPHGMGVAVCRNGKKSTDAHKGIQSAQELVEIIRALKISREDIALIHFRYGTSGSLGPGATHPFPVSADPDDLFLLDYRAEIVVAHNGIFALRPRPGLSDTQTFVCKILAKMKSYANLHADLEHMIWGSRLAMIDRGVLRIAGYGWYDARGLLYSNLSFIPFARQAHGVAEMV